MTVDFENNTETGFDFDPEGIGKSVLEAACARENMPYECQVNISIVDSDSIRDLNSRFRSVDSVTDVLSFPMLSYAEAGEWDEDDLVTQDAFDPETGEVVLGDIVICDEKIRSQAEEYGHSLKREYAFLVAHSVYHLFGFDHMTPEESAVMEKAQEDVLTTLGITRE
ncbi:MAG: rRNA maturation RNase YbeY [Eubacterium sp.]|nr:rRNA maturation RNase YbeY [Eubacterium sp.]